MTLKQLISRENRIIKRALDRHAKKVAHRHRKERGLLKRKLRHDRRVLALRKKSKGWWWFDGLQVAGWIATDLSRARAAGRWKGRLISGRRTAFHSEQLCYAMCGRPACPGKCAGRNSNHVPGPTYPYGAGDVTDPYTLKAEAQRLHLRIKHTLPRDANHFSATGA